jgi:hypothetical protein
MNVLKVCACLLHASKTILEEYGKLKVTGDSFTGYKKS